ncbi:MAG: heavy-metal-associated domain-containing protein [Prolixibacteraceae bacterium]|jgi:copper chaperone CopZ|nr:heavy-metal-associated domain-containing protein [Prolixibacteraceae bacterium]
MKTKLISAIAVFLFIGFTVKAENKLEKIKVKGQCDMCENRIETAVKSLDGVSSAQWDKSNKSLTVSYDDKKTTTQKIQTSIAMAGHDTEMFSASESGYDKLPDCCQYKRDENRKKNNHHGTTESVYKKVEKSGACCENK